LVNVALYSEVFLQLVVINVRVVVFDRRRAEAAAAYAPAAIGEGHPARHGKAEQARYQDQ
jgi:hypothetical protein